MELVETDEAVGARQDVAESGEPGVNRPVVERLVSAAGRVGAGKKPQPALAQRLEPVIRQPGHRVVEAIEVNLHALVQTRLGEPEAVAKARLVRRDRKQNAQLFAAR